MRLRQRTNDLTERSTDLTEALEQQTTTAEVIKVISRSAFKLRRRYSIRWWSWATRLCAANKGTISDARKGRCIGTAPIMVMRREAVQWALAKIRCEPDRGNDGRASRIERGRHKFLFPTY